MLTERISICKFQLCSERLSALESALLGGSTVPEYMGDSGLTSRGRISMKRTLVGRTVFCAQLARIQPGGTDILERARPIETSYANGFIYFLSVFFLGAFSGVGA